MLQHALANTNIGYPHKEHPGVPRDLQRIYSSRRLISEELIVEFEGDFLEICQALFKRPP